MVLYFQKKDGAMTTREQKQYFYFQIGLIAGSVALLGLLLAML